LPPSDNQAMKVSAFVFMTGLCLGPVAAEMSTQDVCVAGDCDPKVAGGRSLLQKLSTDTKESGFAEDGISDAAVDVDMERKEADNTTGALKLPPCSRIPKHVAKGIVKHMKEVIASIPAFVKKCQGHVQESIGSLKGTIAFLEKCFGKYGSFVEDSVSEMAEDDADEPETLDLDELIETGAEELEFDEEDLDEFFPDLDEAMEVAVTADGTGAAEPAAEAPSLELTDGERPKRDGDEPLRCPKVSKGRAQQLLDHLEEELEKAYNGTRMCQKHGDSHLARAKGTLDHFSKCL